MIDYKKNLLKSVFMTIFLTTSFLPALANGIVDVYDQGDENHNWAFNGTLNLDSQGVQAQSFVPSTSNVSKVEFYMTVSTAGNVTLILTDTYDVDLPVGA